MRRLLLGLVGLVLGLLVAEVALRALYPTLPSAVGLNEVGIQGRGLSRHCSEHGLMWHQRLGPKVDQLWVVGDSMVAGHAVAGEDRIPELLGEALDMHARNLGSPGADYCGTGSKLLHELARAVPSRVLVAFFADDLDYHELVVLRNKRIGIAGELPWLARTSWLGNLIWYGYRVRAAEPVERDPQVVEGFRKTVLQLQDAAELAGFEIDFLLMGPVGDCPEYRCQHFIDDGELLSEELQGLGVPFYDMRGIWDQELHRLPQEPGFPIHPNAEGNRLLVEELLARGYGD